VVDNVVNADNDCTEPEDEVAEEGCTEETPEGGMNGELSENMTFYAWLDQGAIPGFQGSTSPDVVEGGEGDNVWQCEIRIDNEIINPPTLEAYLAALQTENPFTGALANCDEPLVILPGEVDEEGETHNIWPALAAAWDVFCSAQNANGHNGYGLCHGIAEDGRMVGSTTYYFGLAWFVADAVGNIIQTDSLVADLIFQVEQHRNNPNPFQP
jgi:hypothetical protein